MLSDFTPVTTVAVRDLETFDASGIIWSDGVASMGDQLRWFADPDGNIFSVEMSSVPT